MRNCWQKRKTALAENHRSIGNLERRFFFSIVGWAQQEKLIVGTKRKHKEYYINVKRKTASSG